MTSPQPPRPVVLEMPEPAAEETEITAGTPLPSRGCLRHEAEPCDPDRVTTVVITGQFAPVESEPLEGFAIELPTKTGRYSAITDRGGYFEIRMPREEFDAAVDLCRLPRTEAFGEEITLHYRLEFDR